MSESTFSFNPPSLDEPRNLAQWILYTAKRSPAHPLFVYGSEHIVTWAQVGRTVNRAARLVDSYFDISVNVHRGTSPPMVGILANLDSITYNMVYLGILRAGGTVFVISTRNSPAAVAHLLQQTGTQRLIVSADEPIQKLVASALKLSENIAVHAAPSFEMLFADDSDTEEYTASGGLAAHIDSPAIILHTSGSGAFPKPLVLTHRVAIQWAYLPDIPGVDLARQRLGVHALPVYHGMGLFITFWAACTGLTLAVFPPQTPPVVPSPGKFLTAATENRCTFILCVPLFLDIWSRDAEAVAQLKKLRGILYGGGPVTKAVGDELTQLGVHLMAFYGATEIGPASLAVIREPGDNEWAWLHLSPNTQAAFISQGDDTFELVYIECATHRPLALNCIVDGKGAFATNDLVIRHPKNEKMFMICGRKDAQIMLSSGEKTNPGPIEAIISRNARVHAAVMFGRARDQNGILIQPANGYEFDPADTERLAQFRNDIWSSVEEANAFAPSHSRLYKEMVLVTHLSRPLEMTAKGTPRRGPNLDAYKDEIDASYAAVERSTQTNFAMPLRWEEGDLLEYVHKVVQSVMEKELRDDADIFEHGGNSLQATYIRNILIHAIRQARKGAAEHISQNFVYENPTISRLAHRMVAIVTTPPEAWAANDESSIRTLQDMEDLASELSEKFSEHRPTKLGNQIEGEVVLLTGSTGGLGSQLLALLASSPEVHHVFALNRPSEDGRKSLRKRQVDAFLARGLDVSIVDSPKVTLVEGDTAAEDLGIDPVLYGEIRDSITLIIHNAWKVNFNLGLGAFKANIRGVRTLVDLALESPRQAPPRFIYAGSVGVFRNWDSSRGLPLETRIDDPKLVLRSGYSESKFVGERILENAATTTPLRPIIVRIGQMTSTANGAWNSGDWLPAIVRSGQIIGVLPTRNDCIAWMSLETAAQAMFEFRHSESQYLHLAHPNPAPWNAVFDVFSSQLNVPLVSWNEWLARLAKCDGSGTAKNPAVYLLDFYRGCAPVALKNREAPGIPLMDMRQALKASPSLADPSLPQIGREDAERWVRFWRSIGFLSNDAGRL